MELIVCLQVLEKLQIPKFPQSQNGPFPSLLPSKRQSLVLVRASFPATPNLHLGFHRTPPSHEKNEEVISLQCWEWLLVAGLRVDRLMLGALGTLTEFGTAAVWLGVSVLWFW